MNDQQPQEEQKPKVNKAMFFVGLIMVLVTAAMFIWDFTGENTYPTVIGIIGLVAMGASKYRLLKSKR